MEYTAADLLSFAAAEHAAMCTTSRSTWYRWRTGRARVPDAALNLLRILVAGELPQGGAEWAAWRFAGGALIDPAGIAHTPASILAWHWIAQELQHRRADENEHTESLPANVIEHPSARPAHALTDTLHRRLRGLNNGQG